MAKQSNEQRLTKTAISQAVNASIHPDVTGDADALANVDYSWDDLNQLKEELGNNIIEFVGQVNSIVTQPEIVNNLGDRGDYFRNVVGMFFKDVNDFSSKVKVIRLQHEQRSGKVSSIDDLTLYNRLAIGYHSLYGELASLIGPTISDLILLSNEIAISVKDKEQNVSDAVVVTETTIPEVTTNA